MILLMGVAGAGKSIQGHQLADEYGYAYISTGEIFRVLFTGRRREEMLSGKLVNDDEAIKVVDRVLELIDTKEQFILDGFPRTKPQIDWLLQQHADGRFEMPVVVNLEIAEEVIRERLHKRGRLDDNETAISQRYNDYQELTLPIISYMQEKGLKVIEIDANDSPAIIHDRIVIALNI